MRLFLVVALVLLAAANGQDGTLSLLPCWEAGGSCAPEKCDEATSELCHELASCDLSVIPTVGCHCPEGLIGNGCDPSLGCTGSNHGCKTEGWAVRVIIDVSSCTDAACDASNPSGGLAAALNDKIAGITVAKKKDWANHLFGQPVTDFFLISSIHHSLSTAWVNEEGGPVQKQYLNINLLFPEYNPTNPANLPDAAAAAFNDADFDAEIKQHVYGGKLVFGARVYRWKAKTTSAPVSVQATGMAVDFVQFSPACKDSGCWVVDVTYTTGDATGNFNTFYLPRVQDAEPWQESFSTDVDWASQDPSTVWDTFFPNKFPCGSNVDKDHWTYNVQGVAGDTGGAFSPSAESGYTSTCCLQNFIDYYRVMAGFETYFDGACAGGMADIVDRPGFDEVEETGVASNVAFPQALLGSGDFSDIDASFEYLYPLDPYIGQHKARIYLDEAELRRKGGLLVGSVGVEYTVDTFIGYANFRPTGSYVLDAAAMQVSIHLEKTNFFSVSTEGENAYTFLEYVNMRLVTVYKEDVVFGGESEDGAADKQFSTRFFGTSPEGSADYVQVTFTMGSSFSPNLNGGAFNGGLIPLSSVRAGNGTFFDDAEMAHKCESYMADPARFWEKRPDGSYPAFTTGGVAPPGGRRSERGGESGGRGGLRRDDSETWGPLDSCQEQSKCMYLEWNAIGGEAATCGSDCEWEVCLVFNADHDPGCRAYQTCEPEWVLNTGDPYPDLSNAEDAPPGSNPFMPPRKLIPSDWNEGLTDYWVYDSPECSSLPEDPQSDLDWSMANIRGSSDMPGFAALTPAVCPDGTDCWFHRGSGCVYKSRCPEVITDSSIGLNGPGDWYDDSFFGNQYMWCGETRTGCPADTDYWQPEVEYFNMTPTYNISVQSKTCQTGKPGQSLFFVMRDGDKCSKMVRTLDDGPDSAFRVPEATKKLWQALGHAFPGGNASAVCEGREKVNNVCGDKCMRILDLDDDGVPDTESGFDTCSGDGDPWAEVRSECVWTVTLPNFCGAENADDEDGCAGSFDDKTGECVEAPTTSSDPTTQCGPPGSPGWECCGEFNERLCQGCAPGGRMCGSPEATPDNFVSFNIPLGLDWFPEASAQLDQNVFVHMVVNALDSSGCADPNSGCDPRQVKTTLFGSIPVVRGGLNIFCDGVRAKTDLKDVANADIVVGTAAVASELSRLRILRDVASTALQKLEGETRVDAASIESAFLTLVVKGNSSYFELPQATLYGLELEDLVTVHIMEPGSEAFDGVQALLGAPPADNYDTTSTPDLDTDGYDLNGAFRFRIDRIENRAMLEPSEALQALCPFNPPQPSLAVPFPSTCVTRRDVRHRGFPNRAGAWSTAMEVVPLEDVAAGRCFASGGASACNTACTVEQNEAFMQTVFGGSDYAEGLGKGFACVVAQQWKLDGRYKRAWWINPTYEWTPSQSGGAPIFRVSQKIFLFALINLNEQFGSVSLPQGQIPPSLPGARRRRLLQNTDSTGSGLGSGVMEFEVSPEQVMAEAFDVAASKVATWQVVLALTAEQACLEPAELQQQLRATLNEYALLHASNFQSLLILTMAVDKDGLSCDRRRLQRRLLQSPTVTVTMMIVFARTGSPILDASSFADEDGIAGFDPVQVPSGVETNPEPGFGRGVPGVEEPESGGPNVGLIAGCAAAGGALLLAVGGFMYWRTSRGEASEAEVASALPDLNALKSQLRAESGEVP